MTNLNVAITIQKSSLSIQITPSNNKKKKVKDAHPIKTPTNNDVCLSKCMPTINKGQLFTVFFVNAQHGTSTGRLIILNNM